MLNTTQVAALPDPPVSRHTVWREIDRGNLQAKKISGVWLIARDEADRWAAQFKPYAELRQARGPRHHR